MNCFVIIGIARTEVQTSTFSPLTIIVTDFLSCDGVENEAIGIRKLAENDDKEEQIQFLAKVNPISTTTEAVEHFHSLSHRKTQVKTVRVSLEALQ